jgi:sugar phosphate isomerase/epimerase
MIEFSCHTWAFNDMTLQEALGTVARLGFRYADIGSGPHLNLIKVAADPRRVASEVTSDLRIFNLKLADIYLLLPQLSVEEESKRRREIDLIKAAMPFLRAVGTPGITLSPGMAQPTPQIPAELEDDERAEAEANAQASAQAAYDRTRDALAEIVEMAGDDLEVSIEPHLDSMAEDLAVARRLLDDIPGLSLTVDWAHLVCADVKEPQIASLLPHARHVQIRQAAKGKLQTSYARGKIDAAAVIDLLRSAGYDRTLCIEVLQLTGWHGAAEVNSILEVVAMRDALREARDAASAIPRRRN